MHPLPEAGLTHPHLSVATRYVAAILRAVDIAQLNPVLRAGLDTWIECGPGGTSSAFWRAAPRHPPGMLLCPC
jgi:hypothetical protein